MMPWWVKVGDACGWEREVGEVAGSLEGGLQVPGGHDGLIAWVGDGEAGGEGWEEGGDSEALHFVVWRVRRMDGEKGWASLGYM